jgi:hypothetical protein
VPGPALLGAVTVNETSAPSVARSDSGHRRRRGGPAPAGGTVEIHEEPVQRPAHRVGDVHPRLSCHLQAPSAGW